MPDQVCAACSRSMQFHWIVAARRAMSFGDDTSSPSTWAETGRQAPCDIGAIDEAMEVSGEASHSPQAAIPPPRTRTNNASWLPSPASVTTGMEM